MAAALTKRRSRDPRLLFLKNFLRHPGEVGSIIPSSRFLERRVVRLAGVESARLVVELGPGTGGTTRALLRAMPPEGRLLAIEINPRFVQLLRTSLPDRRLLVYKGGAAEIGRALALHGLPEPDVVLSGIPFSTMNRRRALSTLRAVSEAMAPHGRFVAYQVRDRVESLGREVFGRPRVQMELLNVPPMRVFRFEKSAL